MGIHTQNMETVNEHRRKEGVRAKENGRKARLNKRSQSGEECYEGQEKRNIKKLKKRMAQFKNA